MEKTCPRGYKGLPPRGLNYMTKTYPFAQANTARVLSDVGVVTHFCVVQYMYKTLSNQTFGNDKNDQGRI